MANTDGEARSGDNRDRRAGLSGAVPVWTYQREPRTFHGNSDEDVDDWLKHYKRVSRYNRWNPTVQLADVVFFLAGAALLWFENHEETL